jgi:hypothetical protein
MSTLVLWLLGLGFHDAYGFLCKGLYRSWGYMLGHYSILESRPCFWEITAFRGFQDWIFHVGFTGAGSYGTWPLETVRFTLGRMLLSLIDTENRKGELSVHRAHQSGCALGFQEPMSQAPDNSVWIRCEWLGDYAIFLQIMTPWVWLNLVLNSIISLDPGEDPFTK